MLKRSKRPSQNNLTICNLIEVMWATWAAWYYC